MDQNQPEKKKEVLQETTPEVIQQAKTIIRTARYGAIATIDPETGAPVCTRIGVSTDIDGAPVVLISRLTAHTNALLKDPRGSLLLGTPGKGDALAHARITIAIEAREIERDSDEAKRLGQRYLCHQPKAQLYAQLGDFRYFKFEPKGASMNGGFGKAYVLTREQLLTLSDSNAELAEAEISAIEHMNDDHAEAVGLYAEHFAGAPAGKWRLVGIDAEGMDLVSGDDVRRVWFETPLTSAKDMHMTLVRMAGEARRALGRPANHSSTAAS